MPAGTCTRLGVPLHRFPCPGSSIAVYCEDLDPSASVGNPHNVGTNLVVLRKCVICELSFHRPYSPLPAKRSPIFRLSFSCWWLLHMCVNGQEVCEM